MEDVIKFSFTIGAFVVAYFLAHKMCSVRKFSFLFERKGRHGSIDGLRGYLAIAVFFTILLLLGIGKVLGGGEDLLKITSKTTGKLGCQFSL